MYRLFASLLWCVLTAQRIGRQAVQWARSRRWSPLAATVVAFALGLLTDPARLGGTDPYFTGATARAAFIAATGITGFVGNIVPVEAPGGAGTRDGHWRESVFDNELMTGYLDTGSNPLSAISVASLRDLGYVVNDAAADAFSLESGFRLPGGPKRQLRELPFTEPIKVVDSSGRTVRTILPR